MTVKNRLRGCKKIPQVTMLLLITLLITGCTFIVHQFGRYAILKEYCEKDAESTNYKEADVDGYFNDTGYRSLGFNYMVSKKFKWVEFCETRPYPISIAPTAGCWRLTRIKRADSNQGMMCDSFIDKFGKSFLNKENKNFFKESCLVAQPIEKQTAEYALFSNGETVHTDKKNQFHISRHEILVKSDTDTAYRGVNYILHYDNPLANTTTGCLDLSEKYHNSPMSYLTAINNLLREEYESQ